MGMWDTAIMGDRNVYTIESLDKFRTKLVIPNNCKKFDDVRIYKDKIKSTDNYQMGVDVSEGIGGDASAISVVDMDTGEESAFWMGQLPPDVLATKAKSIVDYFNTHTKSRMLVVPEVNGLGIGFIQKFKKMYSQIYHREVFLKQHKERKEVIGWKTSVGTKPLLITNHIDFIRYDKLTIHTPELVEQMRTFVYTDDVKKCGAGADGGFHDDAVIAHMLACFFSAPVKLRLMSTDKGMKGTGLAREAYNPVGESIKGLFEKHYDWMIDN